MRVVILFITLLCAHANINIKTFDVTCVMWKINGKRFNPVRCARIKML